MGKDGSVRRNGDRRKTLTGGLLALVYTLLLQTHVCGQVSAYVSSSYGYAQNPLSNYEKAGDQLQQHSLIVNLVQDDSPPMYELGYNGSLVLFNHFSDRNYYEHGAVGRYFIRLTKDHGKVPSSPDSIEQEENSADESLADSSSAAENAAGVDSSSVDDTLAVSSEDSTEDADSTDGYLTFSLAASARHDKEVYADYDNIGTDAAVAYRFIASEHYFLRLTNSLGVRNYQNVNTLSNVTDVVNAEYAPGSPGSIRYGFLFSFGVKFYTNSEYDTTTFETKRTQNLVKKQTGKGKGGINQQLKKNILIQPKSDRTTQIALGVYGSTRIAATGIESRLLFRRNPSSNSRYLAQHSASSTLTTDLYNDSFSYEGFEGGIRFTHDFPFSVHTTVNVEYERKNFNVPALTIGGTELAGKRRDVRTLFTLTLSKDFVLSQQLTLDVSLDIDALRNRSNDEYSDFSGNSISLAAGLAF